MELRNKQELFRLMTGLLYVDVKAKFNMKSYAGSVKYWDSSMAGYQPEEVENECGTSACALGHGIFFCETEPGGDWWLYMYEAFGLEGPMVPSFDFLFSCEWSNDKPQAAARIYTFINTGIPKGHNDPGSHSDVYPVPTYEQVQALSEELDVTVASIAGGEKVS